MIQSASRASNVRLESATSSGRMIGALWGLARADGTMPPGSSRLTAKRARVDHREWIVPVYEFPEHFCVGSGSGKPAPKRGHHIAGLNARPRCGT